MAINWTQEWPLIQTECLKMGLNAYFIAAIRAQENGGPGKEFGVLSVSAPTYADQLQVACETVAHRLALFNGVAHERVGKVSIYSSAFVRWFAAIWAPNGAPNDPTDLNIRWASNVISLQQQFVQEGGPQVGQ